MLLDLCGREAACQLLWFSACTASCTQWVAHWLLCWLPIALLWCLHWHLHWMGAVIAGGVIENVRSEGGWNQSGVRFSFYFKVPAPSFVLDGCWTGCCTGWWRQHQEDVSKCAMTGVFAAC